MFASKVDLYNTEDVLGGARGVDGPLQHRAPALPAHRRALRAARGEPGARRRCAGRTLRRRRRRASSRSRGSHGTKGGKNAGGRVRGRREQRHQRPRRATFPTWTKGNGAVFTPIFGTDTAVKPAADGSVKVTVPPLSVSVWKANKPISTAEGRPDVETVLADGGRLRPHRGQGRRARPAPSPRSPSCGARSATTAWQHARHRRQRAVPRLPRRVRHSRWPRRSSTGPSSRTPRVASRATRATTAVVKPPTQTVPDSGDPPATQPGAVAIAGTLNSEMGCPADWEPWCDQAQMTLDANDKIWKKTVHPAGGPVRLQGGPGPGLDRELRRRRGPGRRQHLVRDRRHGDLLLRPDHALGDLGRAGRRSSRCPARSRASSAARADWDPACMRPWLQDKDGDGVYALITTRIPAGTYELQGRARPVMGRELPRRRPQRDGAGRRRPHHVPLRQGDPRDHRHQRVSPVPARGRPPGVPDVRGGRRG